MTGPHDRPLALTNTRLFVFCSLRCVATTCESKPVIVHDFQIFPPFHPLVPVAATSQVLLIPLGGILSCSSRQIHFFFLSFFLFIFLIATLCFVMVFVCATQEATVFGPTRRGPSQGFLEPKPPNYHCNITLKLLG